MDLKLTEIWFTKIAIHRFTLLQNTTKAMLGGLTNLCMREVQFKEGMGKREGKTDR